MAAPRLLRWLGCLILFTVSQAEVGLLKPDLQSGPDKEETTFCVSYNSYFHPLPPSTQGQTAAPVLDLSHTDGCSSDAFPPGVVAGRVVAVARGNCTFFSKALRVQRGGGVAALIIDYANESTMAVPGGNISEYAAVNITVAVILTRDFTALTDLGSGVKVWLYAPARPTFDPNLVVMFGLATLCVIVGSALSATGHHKKSLRRLALGEDEEEDEEKEETVALGMGVAMSVGLLAFFCLSLTLLYFFYDYLVYVIMGIFCLAGTNGLFRAFNPLWKRVLPWERRMPVTRIPCLPSPPPMLRSLVLVTMCAAFVAVWIVYRHQSFAWILQDIIGFCFCLFVMHTLLMPSLKACSILLGLLFLYDIFFVFITPLFTKDGESVMVKVATGGDSKSGEEMPTVFKIPYFLPWAMSQCYSSKYSLLGYGDVIIPGLLVTYNLTFDLKTQQPGSGRWRFLYFSAACVGYVVGLALTGLALYLMKSGQPALLYLVPCTLFTTMAIAVCRREFPYMWRGHQCPKKNDDVGAGRTTPPGSIGSRRPKRMEEDEEEEEEEEEGGSAGVVSENKSLIQ